MTIQLFDTKGRKLIRRGIDDFPELIYKKYPELEKGLYKKLAGGKIEYFGVKYFHYRIPDSPEEILAQLYVITRLLHRIDQGDYIDLAGPLHRHASSLLSQLR